MDFLKELGITEKNFGAYNGQWIETSGKELESKNPATGEVIATVVQATSEEYERCVEAAQEAFERWRSVPAPVRGEIVRKCGNAIRDKKDALGRLITLEMGKILQEGLGEVQEAIDIADFAVGLSRHALRTVSMHSERPGHAHVRTVASAGHGHRASSRRSTSRWPCGRGTRSSPGSPAATPCLWKPSSLRPR